MEYCRNKFDHSFLHLFVASKAVDALLDSKWGSKTKADSLFTSRAGCVDYCDR